MSTVIVRASDPTHALNVIGDRITPLFTAEDQTGYELFDLRGEAESGPPPHTHPWDEAYYVLEGQVAIVIDAQEHLAKPGHVVNIPAGRLHAYRIVSPEARFLVITTPHGAAAFFADMDANVGALPESLPTLVEVATRNRLTSPLFGS